MFCYFGKPNVFADRQTNPGFAKRDWLWERPRRKHTLLVEHAVVGQFVLETQFTMPIRHERDGVVQTPTLAPWERDDRVEALRDAAGMRVARAG